MALDISRVNTGSSNVSGSGQTVDTGRTEEVNAARSENANIDLSSLKAGQTFTGQVTDITPDKVTIELKNGASLIASYDSKSELVIGDGAKFKVMSNDNGTIVLKALTNSTSMDSAVMKALEANDMPYTARNAELIESLLKNEYPVNRQMIEKILGQALANPDISLKNLVTMNKLGLPIEPANTQMFENYANADAALVDKISSVNEDLLSMIDGLIADGMQDEAGDFAGSVLEALNSGLEPGSSAKAFINEAGTEIPGMPADPKGFETLIKDIINAGSDGKSPVILVSKGGILEGAVQVAAAEGESAAGEGSAGTVSEQDAAISQESGALQGDESVDGRQAETISTEGGNTVIRNGRQVQLTGTTALSQLFSESERLQIFSLFENSDNADAGELQKLLKGSMNLSEFKDLLDTLPDAAAKEELPAPMKKFAEVLSGNTHEAELVKNLIPKEGTLTGEADAFLKLLKNGMLTKEQIGALLHSRQFRNTVKSLLYTNWTLSPESLDKDAVSELFERVRKQTALLDNAAAKASATGWLDNSMSRDTAELNQNLNFMNTMNNIMAYVQLPVRLSGQTATGDLYVYHNKSRGKQSIDEGVSCMLHLDMSHLGAMNVRIEMKGVNVTSKFYLDDKESAALITSHLPELDEAVAKHGFIAKSEVVKQTQKNDPFAAAGGKADFVKDFVEREMPEGRFTRFSFDVRA